MKRERQRETQTDRQTDRQRWIEGESSNVDKTESKQ
jgi:hypothetical protein